MFPMNKNKSPTHNRGFFNSIKNHLISSKVNSYGVIYLMLLYIKNNRSSSGEKSACVRNLSSSIFLSGAYCFNIAASQEKTESNKTVRTPYFFSICNTLSGHFSLTNATGYIFEKNAKISVCLSTNVQITSH